MKDKLNKRNLGLTVGTILPLVIFLVFYRINFSQYDFLEYLYQFKNKAVFVKSMPAMIFINLGLVIVLTKQEMFKFSKGVIMATVFYAVVIFGYAFS